MDFSYTALKSFFHCEYSYYLRYIERQQTTESSASVYGNAIHQTIKAAYDNNLAGDDMKKLFKKEWFIETSKDKNIVFNSERDYITKLREGQEIVNNYYNTFMKDQPAPKSTEQRFGKSQGIYLGGHLMIGVIDQISADDKIIDYKSGLKPNKFELDLDLQFTIYSYVFRQLYGKEETMLVLRHLPTMKDMETTRNDRDFEILAEELEKVEKKIKTGIFVRNLGRDCSQCYFIEQCLGKERRVGRQLYA